MVVHGRPWSLTVDHGSSRSTMVVHGPPWSLTVDHGHWRSTVVIHGRPWSRIVLYVFLTEQIVSTNLSIYDAIIHFYSLIMTLFHTQTI